MDRHVTLEGAQNFRDAGGYATASGAHVRRGVLFRSGSLADLTPGDVARLGDLGIEVVFDLRTQTELDDLGVAPLAAHGFSVRHAPLAERIGPELYPVKAPVRDWTPEDYAVQYTWLLEQGRGAIGAVVRALAGERPAALAYNCTAGRDRTGLVTAVILRALGVSDEDIVADYHLTDRYRPTELGTPAENMTLTLHAMDERWPSIEAYLEQCEVTAEALRGLREHLLEPGPGA